MIMKPRPHTRTPNATDIHQETQMKPSLSGSGTRNRPLPSLRSAFGATVLGLMSALALGPGASLPAHAQVVNSIDTIVGDMLKAPDVPQDRTGFYLDPVSRKRPFGSWPLALIHIPNSAAIQYLVDHGRTREQVVAGVNAATGKNWAYLGPLLTKRPSTDGTVHGWDNIVSWTWVHVGRDNRATNTAVQVRYAEVYVLRTSTGKWELLTGQPDALPADAPTNLKVARQADGSLKVTWTNVSPNPYVYSQWTYGASDSDPQVLDPAVQPQLPENGNSYSIPAAQAKPGVFQVRVFYGGQSKIPAWSRYRLRADGVVEVIADAGIRYPHGQEVNLECTPPNCLPALNGGGELALPDGQTVQVQPRRLPNGTAISYELWNSPCAFCNHTDNPSYPDFAGDVKAIFATAQARLVSVDPSKDDRAKARYYIEQGYDIYQFGQYAPQLDSNGQPVDMVNLVHFDGGISRYKLVTSDWQAFNVITLTDNNPNPRLRKPGVPSGRNVRYVAPYPYEKEVVDPESGEADWNYGLGSPFNNSDYLLTIDQLKANPPPLK